MLEGLVHQIMMKIVVMLFQTYKTLANLSNIFVESIILEILVVLTFSERTENLCFKD